MKLEQAVQGWLISLASENHSKNTLDSYKCHIRKLTSALDSAQLHEVTREDLQKFLIGIQAGRSPRTVQAIYDTAKIFFNWVVREELLQVNPMAGIGRPRAETPAIRPLTGDEFKQLLAACAKTAGGQRRHSAVRDCAMLALLIDTGIRNTELCELRVGDVDLAARRVHIRCGKRGKERYVPITDKAQRYLWRYSVQREETDGWFFVTRDGKQMRRGEVLHLIQRLGRRVGVQVTVHQLRHTFAIEFLRNGGDVFALQEILGHSDLAMTRRYVRLAQVDKERVHKRASPGNTWL